MELTPKELPLVLLITKEGCGACERVRGGDGNPTTDQSSPWNLLYIRNILNKPGSNYTELNASSLNEVHLNTREVITEFSFYSLIPDETEFMGKNSDSQLRSTAVERIKVKRNIKRDSFGLDTPLNSFRIEVTVNTNRSDRLTEMYKVKYIYDKIPRILYSIREKIIESEQIGEEYVDCVEFDEIKRFINNGNNSKNIESYDELITKYYYKFNDFLDDNFNSSFRDTYEMFHPIWAVVPSVEWEKSIKNNNQIYARLTNNETIIKSGRYDIRPFSRTEDIEDVLSKYHKGTWRR